MILSDLVNKSWPVYYTKHDSAMLTYYIGQYLFPALCGKIFGGYRIAEITVLFFNSAGVFLVLLCLFKVLGANSIGKQIFVMIMMVLFGTCLFLSRSLYGATAIGVNDISESTHWISDTILLQYKTNYNNLRWTFPQAIVPWIVTTFLVDRADDVESYLFWALPLLLYSPLALVGIAFIMLIVFGHRLCTSKSFYTIFQCVSFENISALIIFLPCLIYLTGNVLGIKPVQIGFSIIHYGKYSILYFCFVMSFLVYSVIIFDECKNNILFYTANLSLLILPFVKLGKWNDLILNASIPALWILMILTISTWFHYMADLKNLKKWVALSLCLALGAIYPLEEISSTMMGPVSTVGTTQSYSSRSLEEWAKRDGSIDADAAYNYFTYDYNSSLFYSMLAKK